MIFLISYIITLVSSIGLIASIVFSILGMALMKKAGRLNCVFYALDKYMSEGGYIVIGKSKHLNWSHVMYSKDLVTFTHFTPTKTPLRYPWLSKIAFRGTVKIKKVESE